jgi:hypothetical protein
MSPKFGPCCKHRTKTVTNSFGKRWFFFIFPYSQCVLNMFPLSSQIVPKCIPEDVPNSTWVLWSHMVCPKLNSYVYKLKGWTCWGAHCREKQNPCCLCCLKKSGGLKLVPAEISPHGCPEKEFNCRESYLQFLTQWNNAVIKCGHEVQSNCNSVLQRTEQSPQAKQDYNKMTITNMLLEFINQILLYFANSNT